MSYMSADDLAAAQEIVAPKIAIRRMAAEVSELTGIRVAAIYGASHVAKDCRARELLCHMAAEHGYSTHEIGEVLARSHSSIVRAIANEKRRRASKERAA